MSSDTPIKTFAEWTAEPEVLEEGLIDWVLAFSILTGMPTHVVAQSLGTTTTAAQSQQAPSEQENKTGIYLHDPTIQKAMALLDPDVKPSVMVLLCDPTKLHVATPEIRRRLDGPIGGFVMPGRAVIYMSSHGMFYQQAKKGDQTSLYMLAAQIAHENVHIHGGGEPPAYERQLEVFQSFIDAGKVPADEGAKLVKLVKRIAETQQ